MELSPEERRKIYEEEKQKIEAGEKPEKSPGGTQLQDNVAGLLCYLGMWITGIIFLVLEPEKRFVRFHAIQSIVVFASLGIISAIFGWLPVVGTFFQAIFGLTAFIFWIVLMVKAYQGELYKVPVAGDVAMTILDSIDRNNTRGPETQQPVQQETLESETEDLPVQHTREYIKPGKYEKLDSNRGRTGRIVGYSLAIIWNIAALVFLSFFHKYIAIYLSRPDGSITRMPVLTADYMNWLPLFIAVVIISVTLYVFLIIYDRYWFRESCQILMNILGASVTALLVYIFPFDFSVIPDATAASVVPVAVTIVLIMITVGFAIGAIVSFIKLIAYLLRMDSR